MNLSARNTKALSRVFLGASMALLTAFAAAVPAFAWTDNPLTTSTPVRKVHIDELRAAANAKVVTYGFPARAWVDDPTITAGVTLVRAAHITEIRGWITVIAAFYRGVCPGQIPAAPPWTETLTAGSTPIRASHTTEVRSYIDSIGDGSTCCAVCHYPAGYSGCVLVVAGNVDPYGRCQGNYICAYDSKYYVWYLYQNGCNGAGGCVAGMNYITQCNISCTGGATYTCS